jgi:hypothetical protein
MNPPVLAILSAFALLGLAGGAASLAGLRLVADLFARGAAARAAVVQAARLAAVTAAFVCLVRFGAGAALTALAGFVVARLVTVSALTRRT